MKAIVADSRAAAWLSAAEYLTTLDDWEGYTMVLEVSDPMRRDANDARVEKLVDSFLRAREKSPLATVAETIFPGAEYRRHGLKGVYDVYPDEIYPAIKRLPELNWGTYAYRLVRRKSSDGIINPLKVCVDKINDQLGGSINTACYELSMWDAGPETDTAGSDVALYDPIEDCNRRIGGPCLSHLSFKVTRERKILLTAMYRSHYYVQKALGNLLGLARLQAFVCEQTKLMPGPLVCVSTFAKLETGGGWGKSDVENLLHTAGQNH